MGTISHRYLRHKRSNELHWISAISRHDDGSIAYYSLQSVGKDVQAIKWESVDDDFNLLDCVHMRHVAMEFDLVFDPSLRPSRATNRSLGLDVRSSIDVTLEPGQRVKIFTGVSWTNVTGISPGFIAEMQVRARSGHADKHGIAVTNGLGTIDEDYSGNICALLINLGDAPFEIKRGAKIAQIIPTVHPDFEGASEFLENTENRGAKGFGSSGV